MQPIRRGSRLLLAGILLLSVVVALEGQMARGAGPLQSDEFGGTSLDGDRWTVVDPKGDGTVSVGGGTASLSVPAWASHDLWTSDNSYLRIRQAAPNTDFEVDVRFASPVTTGYQMQGILVEQDDNNLVRFDTYHDGSNARMFVATMTGGNASQYGSAPVIPAGPIDLRVTRTGSVFTLAYSTNGTTFTTLASLTMPMTVNSVSVAAGNYGNPAPAFTSSVDYFRVLGADTTAPSISNVSVAPGTSDATVSWTTDEPAGSRVEYGPTPAYGSVELDTSLVTSHSLVLAGLVCGTTYHYRVSSTDAYGNQGAVDDATFTTGQCPPPDTTPPQISAVSVAPASNSADISWTTDEPADSAVDWGTTTGYGQTESESQHVTDHSVTVTGLACETTYHVRVRSSDAAGNEAATGDSVFDTGACPPPDTTPPVISVPTYSPSPTSVTATWTTDEPAASRVEYGLSAAYGLSVTDSSLVTNHLVVVNGLTCETTYHARVVSGDASNNEAASDDATFTTGQCPDVSPPVISGLLVTPASKGATVTWETNEAATSEVEYGPTAAYGSATGSGSLVTDHAIALTGLNCETLHHLRVRSVDAAGNQATSGDTTFTTGDCPTGLQSDEFNSGSLDTGIWTFADGGQGSTLTLTGSHAVIAAPPGVEHNVWASTNNAPRLRQAAPDTDFTISAEFASTVTKAYQMQGLVVEQDNNDLIRFDVYSNGSASYIYAATMTNGVMGQKLHRQVSAFSSIQLRIIRSGDEFTLEYATGNGPYTEVASFTYALDVTTVGTFGGASGGAKPGHVAHIDWFRVEGVDDVAPVVGNVAVSAGVSSATVTWTTDEPADSRVEYGLSAAYGTSVDDSSLVTNHSVVISGLACETTYHARVRSADASGNSAVSSDHTFATDACPPPDTTPPVISGLGITPLASSAAFGWTTDEAASSVIEWGTTPSYGQETTSATLTTSHSVVISGLTCETTYHALVTVTDAADNSSASGDQVFTTGTCVNGIQTDEFNSPVLDAGLWTVEDSRGDAVVSMTGNQVEIAVPAGVSHNLWQGDRTGVMLMQTVSNVDFEATAKFDTALNGTYQQRGLVVEESPTRYLRYDAYYDYGQVRVFAATFDNGVPSIRLNKTLSASVPLQLRVQRTGDNYTLAHSHDGQTWTNNATINHPMAVTRTGPWVGNTGSNPPAHTARIDWFHATGSGGDVTPPTINNVVATPAATSATVTWTTDEPADSRVDSGVTTAYGSTISDPVFQTAHNLIIPNLQCEMTYHFRIRSTDQQGNSAQTTDATFTTGTCPPPDTTPPVIGNVQVSTTDQTATMTWTTDEPADSRVEYGPTTAYGGLVHDPAWTTAHIVLVTGLTCDTALHLRPSSVDAAGNVAVGADVQAQTDECVPTIQSDDFHSATLDSDLWTFTDPKGDSTLTMTGTNAVIHVPARSIHTFWTGVDTSPTLMQPAPDTDFQAEVKFETPLDLDLQSRGIRVEGAGGDAVLLDALYTGSGPRVSVSRMDGGVAAEITSIAPGVAPNWLRLERSGDSWVARYSTDGNSWTVLTSFNFVTTVTEAGVAVGNYQVWTAGVPAQAASIDYFFNSAAPVVPEDAGEPPATSPGPNIDVWYGDSQSFGQLGRPQRWVNIVGNVSDPDGVGSLRYRLNGGYSTWLDTGPGGIFDENARLTQPGDFNVDIANEDLAAGQNTVEITAIDLRGDRTIRTVTVQNTNGVDRPLIAETVEWPAPGSGEIEDVAQVVDGKWGLTVDGLRMLEPGYDRIVAIGAMDWTDFRIRVPVRVNAWGSGPTGEGVGILVGWDGHEGYGQPRVVHPYGALGWWLRDKFEIEKNGDDVVATYPGSVDVGDWYIFEMQTEHISGTTSQYSFKQWKVGDPEPAEWQMNTIQLTRPGSIGLIAHYTDATFGDVQITPLP